jgi:hypothetical protein
LDQSRLALHRGLRRRRRRHRCRLDCTCGIRSRQREGLASVIVVWRFSGSRTLSATSERRAQQLVAVSFFLLAPYGAVEADRDTTSVRGGPRGPRPLVCLAAMSSMTFHPGTGLGDEPCKREHLLAKSHHLDETADVEAHEPISGLCRRVAISPNLPHPREVQGFSFTGSPSRTRMYQYRPDPVHAGRITLYQYSAPRSARANLHGWPARTTDCSDHPEEGLPRATTSVSARCGCRPAPRRVASAGACK